MLGLPQRASLVHDSCASAAQAAQAGCSQSKGRTQYPEMLTPYGRQQPQIHPHSRLISSKPAGLTK